MVLHNREYLDLSGVCRFGMLACQVCVWHYMYEISQGWFKWLL